VNERPAVGSTIAAMTKGAGMDCPRHRSTGTRTTSLLTKIHPGPTGLYGPMSSIARALLSVTTTARLLVAV
jgi:hypothetical protein